MTQTDSTHKAGRTESGDAETALCVPVRRSLWLSFRVGVAAALFSLLSATALAGLLLLLPIVVNGAWVIFAFGVFWFGLFFLSVPWQRRYARSRDLRRPCARLAGGVLTVPLADGTAFSFDLGGPHELAFGWYEVVMTSSGGPTTNTRGLTTYAVLSQDGRELLLQAEESTREARAVGWPNRTAPTWPERRARLWAGDLVALVEAVRSHVPPAASASQENMPQTDAPSAREELVREWPQNPLPARNRHEVTLFLDWLKVELVSRAPAGDGEVCVGRVRGADPAAAPDTYRLVFTLLEPDPADESDFGSGVSKIFDPAELMLLLSRMERDGLLNGGARDMRNDAAHVLTHRTTREIEALRRANERGVSLIEQVLRFAQPEGYLTEESVAGSVKRAWFRGARERLEVNALKARQQELRENLEFLKLSVTHPDAARRQAALVRELRERCPEYLEGLRSAGYEGEHVLHPFFSHAFHLMRFAARALKDGETERVRAAFGAWSAAEPSEVLFPTREFADAVYELNVEPTAAASYIAPANHHYFYTHYETLVDPGYNPWSY